MENTTQTDKVLEETPGVTYIQDISYIASLERLDRLCGLGKIDKTIELHKDGG